MSETLSSIIAKDIQDGCQHRFTRVLSQSDTSLYARTGEMSFKSYYLFVMLDGWMFPVGLNLEQRTLAQRLMRDGVPDMRQQMTKEFEKTLALSDDALANYPSSINLSIAEFLNRMEEAEAHNHRAQEVFARAQHHRLAQKTAEGRRQTPYSVAFFENTHAPDNTIWADGQHFADLDEALLVVKHCEDTHNSPGFYVEMARVVRAEPDGANTLLLQIDRTGNFMIGVSPSDKDYAMVYSVSDWLSAWAIVDARLKLSPLHLAE